MCPAESRQATPLNMLWYALQIRPRYESMAATLLKNKGYDILAPVYHSIRRWSDRTKCLEAPLFPGYIFCQFDPRARSDAPVVKTPGVIKILGFSNKPTPLDEVEIESVRIATESPFSPRPHPYVHAGARVRIVAGPLAGVEGILIKHNKRDALVISVSMLNRSIAVQVDNSCVESAEMVSSDRGTKSPMDGGDTSSSTRPWCGDRVR